MSLEYRVVSKRECCSPKVRYYRTRAGAERRMLLYGPEPWKAFDPEGGPDDLDCCSGVECGCGGMTNRERSEELRARLPRLEWAQLTAREVTVAPWFVVKRAERGGSDE